MVDFRLATAMRVVAAALVFGAFVPGARADGPAIRWQRPGYFFPVLGWREPVDLASDSAFDRLFAALPAAQYNCHFYTKAFIEWQSDAASLPDLLSRARADLLTAQFLARHGYQRVEQGAAVAGDVIVAGRRGAEGEHAFTHSAIVEDVDANGRILRIRQKFNAECPVVDLRLDEFVMLYAGMYPWETQLWRKSGAVARDLSASARVSGGR